MFDIEQHSCSRKLLLLLLLFIQLWEYLRECHEFYGDRLLVWNGFSIGLYGEHESDRNKDKKENETKLKCIPGWCAYIFSFIQRGKKLMNRFAYRGIYSVMIILIEKHWMAVGFFKWWRCSHILMSHQNLFMHRIFRILLIFVIAHMNDERESLTTINKAIVAAVVAMRTTITANKTECIEKSVSTVLLITSSHVMYKPYKYLCLSSLTLQLIWFLIRRAVENFRRYFIVNNNSIASRGWTYTHQMARTKNALHTYWQYDSSHTQTVFYSTVFVLVFVHF